MIRRDFLTQAAALVTGLFGGLFAGRKRSGFTMAETGGGIAVDTATFNELVEKTKKYAIRPQPLIENWTGRILVAGDGNEIIEPDDHAPQRATFYRKDVPNKHWSNRWVEVHTPFRGTYHVQGGILDDTFTGVLLHTIWPGETAYEEKTLTDPEGKSFVIRAIGYNIDENGVRWTCWQPIPVASPE